ncbi:MAG: hypothetical protein A49_16300 [Methyloceanibacter sp.]|nr:MAG: hypothetical protein A49_16300 [Methyloceanibacter sp.]
MHTSTVSLATLTALLLCCRTTLAQPSLGTAFTYQGELRVGGVPVSETCDFRFGLWDADVAGNEVGASPANDQCGRVVNGTFGVAIDFGTGAITATPVGWRSRFNARATRISSCSRRAWS